MQAEAYRRAALSLFALGRGDREWLLDRLNPHQRTEIKRLLAELSHAGLSPTQVKEVLAQQDALPQTASPAPQDIGREIATIDQASSQQIGVLLANEPDWTIGVVLANYQWRWTEEYLLNLEALRRGRLLKAIREVAPNIKAKVRRTIIATLAQRISAAKPEENTSDDRFDEVFRRVDRRAVKQQVRRS